jgi:hypothetical protein
VQVFRCSVKEKKEMGEIGRRERKKSRIYNKTRRERNDMYVCMSKGVREKILLLRLYYIE